MRITTDQGAELVQIDGRPPDADPADVLLVSCVRDEATRLPDFLTHYRRLGVDRFVFVDNASTDGTTDLLLEQPDTHVFRTTARYVDGVGVGWVNAVAARLGRGHWVVVADADELLVYPDSERTLLPELTARLDADGSTALLAFLLDMYAAGPIRSVRFEPGGSMLETCPFFDTDTYVYSERTHGGRVPERGGARRRLFWPDADDRSLRSRGGRHRWLRSRRPGPPFLPKVPLARWGPGVELVNAHTMAGVELASTTGALLHFKLLGGFATRAAEIEARYDGEERDQSWRVQNRTYADVLAAEPDLDPIYRGSARFEGTGQLVRLGLLHR